jgi:hypothetical protein
MSWISRFGKRRAAYILGLVADMQLLRRPHVRRVSRGREGTDEKNDIL